jgi:hypothetical protein
VNFLKDAKDWQRCSASELDDFNRILVNQKLELARKIDEINPKQKEATSVGRSDIFEI